MMRLAQNPIYRKEIIPWYDSEMSGLTVVVLMVVVLLFGAAGLAVAHGNPDYHDHAWVPALLVALSLGVVVSTTIRMVKRYLRRVSE